LPGLSSGKFCCRKQVVFEVVFVLFFVIGHYFGEV
jgi:hypothetical protein